MSNTKACSLHDFWHSGTPVCTGRTSRGSIPLTRCNDVICRHNISIIEDYYSYTIDHQLLWMRCLDDNYFAPAAPAYLSPSRHAIARSSKPPPRPFIQACRAARTVLRFEVQVAVLGSMQNRNSKSWLFGVMSLVLGLKYCIEFYWIFV